MTPSQQTQGQQTFGIANILTIARMFLIPVFVIASVYQHHKIAFFTFLVAGITDFLDGYIARYTEHVTDIGKFMDPMADKVMLISVYVILSLDTIGNTNIVPIWLTILIIFRDVFIAILAVIIYFTTSVTSLTPSILGKLCTFFQIVTASTFLLFNSLGISYAWMQYLVYAAGFFTLTSGLHYIARGLRRSKS